MCRSLAKARIIRVQSCNCGFRIYPLACPKAGKGFYKKFCHGKLVGISMSFIAGLITKWSPTLCVLWHQIIDREHDNHPVMASVRPSSLKTLLILSVNTLSILESQIGNWMRIAYRGSPTDWQSLCRTIFRFYTLKFQQCRFLLKPW